MDSKRICFVIYNCNRKTFLLTKRSYNFDEKKHYFVRFLQNTKNPGPTKNYRQFSKLKKITLGRIQP